MGRRSSAVQRRVRVLLLAVVSIGVLLFGIADMHAGMVGGVESGSEGAESMHTMSAPADHVGVVAPEIAAVTASDGGMQHGMGGMTPMDCLLLGMVCVLGALAVLLLVPITRLASSLRRRLSTPVLLAAAGLRPPEPPSLLVLSISRT